MDDIIIFGSCDSCPFNSGSILCLTCAGVYEQHTTAQEVMDILEADVVEEMSVADAAAVAKRVDVESIPALCKSPDDCNQPELGMCVNCPFTDSYLEAEVAWNALKPPCWTSECPDECTWMADGDMSKLRGAGLDHRGTP